MNSTMLSKLKNVSIRFLLPIVFWLTVWQIGALIVKSATPNNTTYFLPTVTETFFALIKIIKSEVFFKTVAKTLLRIIFGLFLGTSLGIFFGIVSYKSKIVYSLLSPAISVVKAVPVASIIILLWISLSGDMLSVVIALLMVLPIIWQNVYDGLSAVNKELSELAFAYEFSFVKKMKILVMPTLSNFLIPAIITATGLAFKSEIAAEIIAGVRDSIGQMIYHSKDAFDTAAVFAWTIVGVFFSIVFEKLTRSLLLKMKSKSKKEAKI